MCVGMHNKNIWRNWGSRTSHLWQSRQSRSAEVELQIFKSRQKWNVEVDLSVFGSPGRISAEDERDLSKSWPSGRNEIWTYPYLEVLAEEVRKMNEIFRSPGRVEEMKCGLIHIWKSWQNKCGRWTRSFEVLAEWKYRKRNFRFLAVKTEWNCGSKASDL